MEIKRPQELARLRRLALTAQGLLQAQPYGRGLAGARKAINHIGYVQIDTLSVVDLGTQVYAIRDQTEHIILRMGSLDNNPVAVKKIIFGYLKKPLGTRLIVICQSAKSMNDAYNKALIS